MAGQLSVGLLVQGALLGTVGAVTSLALLALNVKLRNSRLIKMSSPCLNVVIALGAVILNACCVMYGLDYFTATYHTLATVVCRVRVSSLVCGVTLVYAPMLLKAWRIQRIFHRAAVQRVAIRDNKLLAVTGAVLSLDVIILGLWHGLDPIEFATFTSGTKAGESYSNGNFSTYDVTRSGCTSRHAHAWAAGIYAMKTIMLLYGLLLAWRIRNVMLPSFSDAKCIIVSSLATALLASLTTAVAILLQDWPNAVYACVIASIWVSTSIVLYQVFITKMLLWWKNPDLGDFRFSGKGKLTTIQSFEELEEELFSVIAENRALKKSLEQKSKDTSNQNPPPTATETEAKQDSGLDISCGEGEGDAANDVRPAERSVHMTTQDAAENPADVPAEVQVASPSDAAGVELEPVISKSFTGRANRCFTGSSSEIFADAELQDERAKFHPVERGLPNVCMLHTALPHQADVVRHVEVPQASTSGRGRHCRKEGDPGSWVPSHRKRDPSSGRGHSKFRRSGQGRSSRRSSAGSWSSGGFVQHSHDVDGSGYERRRRFSMKTFAALSREVSQSSKRRSLLYDSFRSKRDVSGAIARSYNLQDDEDTYSYVSSYLPSTTSFVYKVHDGPGRCQGKRTQDDSYSTLGNDKMYPDLMFKAPAKRKHRRKAGKTREPIRASHSYDVSKNSSNRNTFTTPEECEFLGFRGITSLGSDTFV